MRSKRVHTTPLCANSRRSVAAHATSEAPARSASSIPGLPNSLRPPKLGQPATLQANPASTLQTRDGTVASRAGEDFNDQLGYADYSVEVPTRLNGLSVWIQCLRQPAPGIVDTSRGGPLHDP